MRSMQYIWKNSPNGRLPYRLGMLLITISLLASACAAAAPGDLQETPGSQEPAATETPADTATPPAPELFPTVRAPELIPVIPGGPVTPIDPGQPVTGEASAGLMEDIRADLAERSGAAREEMVVIRDQAVTWSDGSLGCPQPGVFYTQALVPGYWVVLQVGEVEYDYRASERGYFVLCEGGGLPFSQPQDQ
jgi:hypothetical protein